MSEYEIRDRHHISSPGNLTKGNDLKEDWRDVGETSWNWKSTIWQRIVQDRQTWKQNAEAFAQPRDAIPAQLS